MLLGVAIPSFMFGAFLERNKMEKMQSEKIEKYLNEIFSESARNSNDISGTANVAIANIFHDNFEKIHGMLAKFENPHMDRILGGFLFELTEKHKLSMKALMQVFVAEFGHSISKENLRYLFHQCSGDHNSHNGHIGDMFMFYTIRQQLADDPAEAVSEYIANYLPKNSSIYEKGPFTEILEVSLGLPFGTISRNDGVLAKIFRKVPSTTVVIEGNK